MCDQCVMNSVKERMLSRRQVLGGAAAGVAAAAAVSTTGTGTPALAMGHNKVEDLTHELHDAFPRYRKNKYQRQSKCDRTHG